jgi:LacI family transcriptional regulator
VACGNDEMAYGAMQAIREYGYDIPKHISIVGFDNIEFSRFSYPKLTTINYPMDLIGEAAANRILCDVYQETEKSEQQLFDPQLITRDSVARPLASM